MRASRSEKAEAASAVLQVWHFTFGSRGEIFLDLRSPSAKTLWETNITGDLERGQKEFGFRKRGNKRGEKLGLKTALDWMGTFRIV